MAGHAPSADLTIDKVFAAVADAHPDRPCVIQSDAVVTYGRMRQDADALARFLIGRGHTISTERGALQPWQSGQSPIGLLMYNSPQYLAAELAAVRARAAAINVNYRYVAAELDYIAADAGLEALIFHSSCAEQAASACRGAAGAAIRTLVQVPDVSGRDLLPGAVWYDDALAEGGGSGELPRSSPDDAHILYTGGTTGKPKGVIWRQGDIIIAGMGGRRPDGAENRLADFLHSASQSAARTLPAGPFMHASGRWTALSQLMLGNVVLLPPDTVHFDPAAIWSTLARHAGAGLNIVGDAMAKPLLAELAHGGYDLAVLRMISSGAAILSDSSRHAFHALLPHVRISDTVGSSETGSQATTVHRKADAGPEAGRFAALAGTTILREDRAGIIPKDLSDIGWLARSGRIPLGYLNDAAKTALAFPTLDGQRYAVPGDRARWDAAGQVQLLGRDAATINSGGEKIFAEEVELALKRHPAITDAIVCGRPSARWGQEVVALVALSESPGPDDADLLAECGRHLARYKLPKAILRVARVVRSPSGKPDYAWARSMASMGAPEQPATAAN